MRLARLGCWCARSVYGGSRGGGVVWCVSVTGVLLRMLENGQPLSAGCLLEVPVRDASVPIPVVVPVDA